MKARARFYAWGQRDAMTHHLVSKRRMYALPPWAVVWYFDGYWAGSAYNQRETAKIADRCIANQSAHNCTAVAFYAP